MDQDRPVTLQVKLEISDVMYVPIAILVLLQMLAKGTPSPSVAICAVVRDQNDDLQEWVEHHRSIGVHKFYIYDNGSNPPASDVLLKHITAGVVTCTTIPDGANGTNAQFNAYNMCLTTYSSFHGFLGFIDVDEFVTIALRRVTISSILSLYTDYVGLSLNWKIYGSSGHDSRPAGGMQQNYCTCEPGYDKHTKVFVNTAKVLSMQTQHPLCAYGGLQGRALFTSDPHQNCFMGDNSSSVSITHREFRGPFHALEVTSPLMYIKHYITRSREDYQKKLDRGRADLPLRHGHPLNDRDWEFFEYIQTRCTSRKCGCSIAHHFSVSEQSKANQALQL